MNENKKFCSDCKTTKTPLWRTGPAGPRTLCNACGIRYRKRKVGDEGQSKSTQPNREKSSSSSLIPNDRESRINSNANLRESLKLRLMYLETEMMFHTAKSPAKKQRSSNSNSGRRKLGEVEAAAVLLLSLSCGSVS
ncbi:hypothetical protein Nepgr_009569 [Nepenthes gracilis]|uniref:GATA-type domain-containing protein n=1 Tax=Nepenthes gracilis TaxID=150966 RepID=A0AAD3SBJ5_NEPGR|nr:hypothetical protein Nepgr_009569 [Nepenthes gracilis]